jgi:hypothetical protein
MLYPFQRGEDPRSDELAKRVLVGGEASFETGDGRDKPVERGTRARKTFAAARARPRSAANVCAHE